MVTERIRGDTGVFEPVTGYPARALRAQVDPNPRRDAFVRVVLPLVAIVMLIVLLVGCAHDSEQAIVFARAELATVRDEADAALDLHMRAAEAAVARCRAELGEQSTPELRHACMARQQMAPEDADRRLKVILRVSQGYDNTIGGLEELERLVPELRDIAAVAERVLVDGNRGRLAP